MARTSPTVSAQHEPDCASGNAVNLGELSCARFSVIQPDGFRRFPSQLVAIVVLAPPIAKYAFLAGILAILCSCSDPQVFGIDASGIVSTGAVVTHAQPFCDVTSVHNPRSDVGPDHFRESTLKIQTSTGQHAVSVRGVISGPQPTPIGTARFIHLGPEPFFYSFGESIECPNGIGVGCDALSSFLSFGICGNFVLHNQIVWLCHAPGLAKGAGANSTMTDLRREINA